MSNLHPSRARALPASELQAERLVGRTPRGGKLLVEAFVGSGRTGAVYRARHRELRKAIAVKVLHSSLRSDDGFCARFQAEARAACRLDHQNLTRGSRSCHAIPMSSFATPQLARSASWAPSAVADRESDERGA
jgi:hypothetical protein